MAVLGQGLFKAHGTGNDFVVVVDSLDEVELPAGLVAALCDRHTGIGGDGVIRIGGPPAPGSLGDVDVAGADVFMDYRNADGGIVEMCGNGVRVVAKLVVDLGIVPAADAVAVATRAGVKQVTVTRGPGPDDSTAPRVLGATVDMGPAAFGAAAIGLDPGRVDGDEDAFTLPEAPDRTFTAVSMGNPHAVTVVDDPDEVLLASLGPVVERHDAFADGVNVNVVEVVDDAHLRLRVWERGVGETMACGTGACATTAAMGVAGRVDVGPGRAVTVSLPGGDLQVERDDRGHLLMTGPAEVVGSVDLDADWLAARRA